MDNLRRGKAIIIFNEEFPYANIKPIRGIQDNVDHLTKGLQKLRFQVELYNDLSKAEMTGKLEKVAAEDHSEADCLVLILMSVGNRYGLVGNDYGFEGDYGQVPMCDIVDLFKASNCRSLAGKPKLFIIDAFQNSLNNSVESNLNGDVISRTATPSDTLVFYYSSNVLDEDSSKIGNEGSTFISCLARVLYEYGEFLPLGDLLLVVKERVTVNVSTINVHGEHQVVVQMPTVLTDTLRKKICFHKKKLGY